MNALRIIRRGLALVVGVWALGVAGFYLFFANVSFETTTATSTPGELPITTSGQIGWLSQAGPWAVTVMLIITLILIAGAVSGWRGALSLGIPLSLLALVATYLTGFSIGGLFFPGSVMLLLCMLFLVVEKLSTRPHHSAA